MEQLPEDRGSLSQGVNLSVVEKWTGTGKCRCERGKETGEKDTKTEIQKQLDRERQREDVTSLKSQPHSAIVVQMVLRNCTSAS